MVVVVVVVVVVVGSPVVVGSAVVVVVVQRPHPVLAVSQSAKPEYTGVGQGQQLSQSSEVFDHSAPAVDQAHMQPPAQGPAVVVVVGAAVVVVVGAAVVV